VAPAQHPEASRKTIRVAEAATKKPADLNE
jgi:hypothetical protein